MLKVERNIGILNAMIRITIGLSILSWSTAKLVRRPYCNSYLFFGMCGAMKVAEGIVRYCPVTALFQQWIASTSIQKKDNSNLDPSSFEETVQE